MKYPLPFYQDNSLVKMIEIRAIKYSLPLLPFANNEYYESDSSIYVILNKIRDAYGKWIRPIVHTVAIFEGNLF